MTDNLEAATVSVEDMSYEQLRKMQDELDAVIAKKEKAARAEAINTIVGLIKEFGFTADELNKAINGKPVKVAGKAKVAKEDAPVRAKAKPKYRNPETGETWSGRGIAPLWIRDVEDRTKFLIETPVETAPAAETASEAPVEPTPVETPVEAIPDLMAAPVEATATTPIFV